MKRSEFITRLAGGAFAMPAAADMTDEQKLAAANVPGGGLEASESGGGHRARRHQQFAPH